MKRSLSSAARPGVFGVLVWVCLVGCPAWDLPAAIQDTAVVQSRKSTAISRDQIRFSDLPRMPQAGVAGAGGGVSIGPEPELAGGSGGGEVMAAGAPPSVSPLASASFSAIEDDGTRFVPNSTGAVGLNHVMTVVSSGIRIQDRAGNDVDTNSNVSLSTFWAGLGVEDPVDPKLVYEPFAARWVLVSVSPFNETNVNPGLLVAVSHGEDPTGGWDRYFIDVDEVSPQFIRSPNVGFNKDWVAIQANTFDTNFTFTHSEVFIFGKASLFGGTAAGMTRVSITQAGDIQNCQVPAATYSPTQPTLYLVSNWANNVDGVAFLRVWSISGPVNSPVLNPGAFTGQFQSAPPGWEDLAPGDGDFGHQMGTTNKVYLGDARIQNVVFRNSSLWFAHTIYWPLDTPEAAAVQWWELSPGALIIQRGVLAYSQEAYAFPSIAVNNNNDVLIGYSRFAVGHFPMAGYAFRTDPDVFSVLRGERSLKAGEASYYQPDGGVNPWGNWSATVIDPANDTDLWTLQQYAESPGVDGDRWGTWWGRVAPPTTLAITMTDSPDPVNAGRELTYQITVTNSYRFQRVASGVTVTNTLPAGAVFVSATPSQGTCSHSNGVVTCRFGAMGPQSVATATIVVSPQSSGANVSTAVVGANGEDEDSSDNSASTSTSVLLATDLAVSQTESADPAVVGRNLTYSVVVTNRGPSTAAAVALVDTLPSGAGFVSVESTRGSCSHNGGIVNCNLGSMAQGVTAVVTIVVTRGSAGTVNNQVSVSTTTPENDPGNNTSVESTTFQHAPTIAGIGPQTTVEEMPLGPLAVTVGDTETPAGSLVLSGSSSVQSLVSNVNIVFGGSGASRTVTITPLPNQFGMTTITLTVTDGNGASSSTQFLLTVEAGNDPPTISAIADQTTNEDAAVGPLAFTIGDDETPAGSLVVTAVSDNQTLVPSGNILLGGAGAGRTVRVTPAADRFGQANITVRVSDGDLMATEVFRVTVISVNDLPTLSPVGARVFAEDQSSGVIGVTVGDVETTPGSLILTARSTNPSLVAPGGLVLGGSGANRTLVVSPIGNAFGTGNIELQVVDAHGGTNVTSFAVTVVPVNDAPTLGAIAGVVVAEDSGSRVVSLTGIGTGAANESDTLMVSVMVGDDGLGVPVIAYTSPSPTGSLTFQLPTNFVTLTQVTVTVNDGQPTNNTVSRMFAFQITPVNDPPIVTGLGFLTVDEDTPVGPIAFTAFDIDGGIGVLTLSAIIGNEQLIPPGNLILNPSFPTPSFSLTLATNVFGDAAVAFVVSDGLASTTNIFNLTVLPVNDPPVISVIPDLEIAEDEVSGPFAFTVTDPESAASAVTLSVASADPELLPEENVMFGGAGSARTMTLIPAGEVSGSLVLLVTATDEEDETTSQVVSVTIVPVNDPPAIDPIGGVTVAEDSGLRVVNLTGIGSGAPNESQVLTVTAISGDPLAIPDPVVTYSSPGGTATLRFTPAPNADGEVPITVRVSDDGLTNNVTTVQFVVNIIGSNDDPSITQIADQTLQEDQRSGLIHFTVSDPETPGSELTVYALSGNPEVISDEGIILGTSLMGNSRTITLEPLANQSGTATLAVVVDDPDGGAAVMLFLLIVNEVNDFPVISAIPDQTFNEERTTALLNFRVSDIETLPGGLVVTAVSSDPVLLPPAGVQLGGSGENRSITVTPAANEAGFGRVTVTVRDGAGAESSGSFGVNVFSGAVLHTSRSGQDVVLSWSTNYPNHYLMSQGTLDTGWSLMAVARPVVVNEYSVAVTPGGSQAFFRLVEVLPPTVASIPDQSIVEDGATGSIDLGLSDGGLPGVEVDLGLAVSNPALLPLGNITINGTGTGRSLVATPLPDGFGAVTVTVFATNAVGVVAEESFVLTVRPVNDPPSFAGGSDELAPEDAGSRSVAGWAGALSKGPSNESGQTLLFLVSNDNNALFSIQPAIGADGTLTYTPAPNASGAATVTVRLMDDGGTTDNGMDTSAVRTFDIIVRPVNDAPSFTGNGNESVLEDAGLRTVPGWATAIVAGPPSEAGQGLMFILGNNNNGLFAVQPSISPAGVLTYQPAGNASGVATVTVRLVDDGGVADGGIDTSGETLFTITVTMVNDAPSFTAGANQSVLEDAGARTVPGWATGLSAGPANESGQVLSFEVSNDNNALFSVQPAIASNGTLTYTPAANAGGTALVSVRLLDNGGTANGGVNASGTAILSIMVNPVNDVPTFVAGPDVTVLEDAGAQSGGWATAISAGPGEGGQTVEFLVANDNNGLFLVQPAIGAGGTLSYTPAANLSGTAVVTVRLRDNGGTADGGVDTSAPLTFNLHVTAVNDAPVFVIGTNVTVREDAVVSIPAWVTGIGAGPNESGQVLTFVVSNDFSGLFSVPPAVAADGTLSFAAAPDAHGVANLTLQLRDDGGTANGGADRTVASGFTITVLSVNDAPTFIRGADIELAEDAGAQSVPGWAQGIGPGAANEAGQALAFDVSNDNPALFALAPSISAGGQLAFTLAADAHGTALVTVRLGDDGGTANGGVAASPPQSFTIQIRPVNDPPAVAGISDIMIDEDAPEQVVPVTGISSGAANETGPLVLTATSDNPGVIPHPTVVYSSPGVSGMLRFTPVSDANGSAAITVTVNDGGSSNQSASVMFTVVVAPINDDPVIAGLGDWSVNEDEVAGPLAFTVVDAETPAAGLIVSVETSDTNLVALSGLVLGGGGADRTLTVFPSTNRFGVVTITLRVEDGVGGIGMLAFELTVDPVNDHPILGPIDDVTIAEETVTGVIPFTVGDVETPAGGLVVTAFSSNPALVPVGNIILGGADANRTVQINPVPTRSGLALITVVVSDGGASVSNTFLLTVTGIADPPFIAGIPAASTDEDVPVTIPLMVGDEDTEVELLILRGGSSNLSLLPEENIRFDGSGSNRTVTLIPAPDQSGTVTVVVIVDDGMAVASTQFDLTVTPVNDPPTLDLLPDLMASTARVLIGRGSVWKYLDDGSDQGVLWRGPGYDDSSWASGAAGFGYGEAGLSTEVSYGPNPANKHITTYFRHAFVIPDPTGFTGLGVNVQRDDGAVIYLNGMEVFRTGMDPGMVTFLTLANEETSGNAEATFFSNAVPAHLLVAGVNVVAVELHQRTLNTSDARFDMDLVGVSAPGATVALGGIGRGAEDETTGSLAVSVVSGNPAVMSAGPLSYTSPSDRGAVELLPGSPGMSIITVTVDDGGLSNNLFERSFRAYVSAPGNTLPALSAIGPRSIVEDSVLGPVGLTVGDAETAAAQLLLVGRSSDPDLVPDGSIVFGGSGSSRTVRVTPVSGRSGVVTITIELVDGGFGMVSTAFELTVTAENDPPTISVIADQAIPEEGTTGFLPFAVGDDETPAGLLTVGVRSSRPEVIPSGNVIVAGSGAARVVKAAPLPGAFGSVVLSLTVMDEEGAAATEDFVVVVGERVEVILTITRVDPGTVRLSWPVAVAGYELQSRAGLEAGELWTPVGVAPMVAGDEWAVELGMVEAQYFRLIRP